MHALGVAKPRPGDSVCILGAGPIGLLVAQLLVRCPHLVHADDLGSIFLYDPAETRAVLQPFNFVTLVIMASVFAARGTYTAELLPKLAVALLSSLLAAQLGVFAFRRLSDAQFRWLIVGLMTLSGAALLARTVL